MMKNCMMVIIFCLLFHPGWSFAQDFLGAPVMPGGKEILKTDTRLELGTGSSHDEVVEFYREALKGSQDIKFREWRDATYIEDDGKLAWHSITISKEDEGGVTVIIVKDNWTWIIGTLVLRYIGVFVVLMILFLGISISGGIISRSIRKMEAKKAAD